MNDVDIVKICRKFQEILGVTVMDETICLQALTHKSVKSSNKDVVDNERLEFLGDAVLELIVTKYLFQKYSELPEGELTSIRSALVKTESLAVESKRLGIDRLIIMSDGEEAGGGRRNNYILANFFESSLGALYITHSFLECENFVQKNLLYKADDIVLNDLHRNDKTLVQELVQDKFKLTPEYRCKRSEGPDHHKTFEMVLVVNDIELTSGIGHSKQKAEQIAARNFLSKKTEYLEIIKKKL